jgi:hypothetical protein
LKVTYGTDGYDVFETDKSSETILARGGNDQFQINYDQLGAHSVLNLMGQGGTDYFWVNVITSDLLQPASGDQQVNIYGGKEYDHAEFYYEGEGGIHIQDIIDTASLHSVESVTVDTFLTHGKAIGTAGDDAVFLSATDNQRSYLVGGAGADHLLGQGQKAAAVIEGGNGRDVIGSSAYLTSAGQTEADGGAGDDYFVLNIVPGVWDLKNDFRVMDFERGSDHFLIMEMYDHFFDFNPGKAKQDDQEFRKMIDFHDGKIFYRGQAYAEVEGVTHLSSSDFVFL